MSYRAAAAAAHAQRSGRMVLAWCSCHRSLPSASCSGSLQHDRGAFSYVACRPPQACENCGWRRLEKGLFGACMRGSVRGTGGKNT